MRKLLLFIICLFVVVLGLLLGATNQQLAELNLLVVKLELRVIDIAVIFTVFGLLLGILLSILFVFQRNSRRWFSKATERV